MSISRRAVIAVAILPFTTLPAARAQSEDPAIIAAWMDAWMSDQKATLGTLQLSRFVEPIYYLTKPTTWLPDKGQERLRPVNVPVGFVTDFASIPRAFWSALRPDGNYTHAAIVHDYLYWTQTTPREHADEILKIMMEDFSVAGATVAVIYSAVRTFGAAAWDQNMQLKAAGERRVLKLFPDDPLTTWKEWKRRQDVFTDV